MSEEMRLSPEMFADFQAEAWELIESLIEDLLALEEDASSADLLQRIFRTLHTVKGNAGFLGYKPMVELSHRAEDLVSLVRAGQLPVTSQLTDALLLVADGLRNLLECLTNEDAPFPELDALTVRMDALLVPPPAAAPAVEDGNAPAEHAAGVESAADPAEVDGPAGLAKVDSPADPGQVKSAAAGDVEDETSEEDAEEESTASGAGRPAAPGTADPTEAVRAERDAQTVRVDVLRIDQLMNQVGELVLERNRLQQIVVEARARKDLSGMIEALADNAERIHSITSELQMSILKVRMVPVERIFRKFPRVVRELSAKLGKEVHFSSIGGDTELDKAVAEAILDPLTHLVRNSLDHGLERAEERLAAGKPSAGQLTLKAAHEGNHILVRVSDDGRGIDPDVIRARALRLGMVTREQLETMGRHDVVGLIFQPGFSTSESVSEVSGRGVGLDVVRTHLKHYQGIIEIHSEPGLGTEVTLKLPLTLAIVPSLLVAVGGDHFAVPLGSIIEVVNAGASESRHSIHGRPVLRWRDRVLPLVDLAERFHRPSTSIAGEGRKVVVVGLAERQVAFLVDALLGQEEVVIKSLGSYLGHVPGIAGGTILGDGRVALIVDIPGLVGRAHEETLAYSGR